MTSKELNPQSIKFMEMFDLKYPIIQAPTDGPATADLAIAVGNSGCMGALPLTWVTPEESFKRIQEVKSKTKGPIFANFVLNFIPTSLNQAIAAGIEIVQFSWGLPDSYVVEKLRSNGIKLGIQVASKEGAIEALKLNPDYLVCQGTEAGGHVQSSQPLMPALLEVLSIAKDIPVAASGGISTGEDIHKYLSAGAAAVVMGPRFVATKESFAHDEYKKALIEGSATDTVFTVCLNRGWNNGTHRILKNSTFNMWSAAGCPQPGSRPGETDIVAQDLDGTLYQRYSNNTPIQSNTGDVMALGPYAGFGVDSIKDIPSVEELVKRLWREYLKYEA